jgi:hypothetical protein
VSFEMFKHEGTRYLAEQTPEHVPVPVDWPARFRKAADVIEHDDWIEPHYTIASTFEDLARWIERLPPHVVEAIGRELGGGT